MSQTIHDVNVGGGDLDLQPEGRQTGAAELQYVLFAFKNQQKGSARCLYQKRQHLEARTACCALVLGERQRKRKEKSEEKKLELQILSHHVVFWR
jgi:hypothetical protein